MGQDDRETRTRHVTFGITSKGFYLSGVQELSFACNSSDTRVGASFGRGYTYIWEGYLSRPVFF